MTGDTAVARIVSAASERLSAVEVHPDRQEQVAAFRRFLRIETERLRMRHRFGLGGDDIAVGRSHQVDLVIRRVCQVVAEGLTAAAQGELGQLALVALGGYGRGELAPFSDVDLLFLHGGQSSAGIKGFVEQVLALLWDIGFTVGHSYRSVGESVAMARTDLHSRTALAEARLLTGSATLFAELERSLGDAVFRRPREVERFVVAMRAEIAARYEKYGRAVGLLEPNLKESAGGLRDIHALLWLGHARTGGRRLEDLRNAKVLTETEYVQMRRAHAFLWRVRNEAHFCAGRKADLLSLELQPDVAAGLGYKPSRDMAASERLMRDYYERAHDVHHVFESFMVRQGLHAPRRRMRLVLPFGRAAGRFESHKGQLHFNRTVNGFGDDPHAMLDAFDEAQARDLDLAEEVQLAVRQELAAVDGKFRSSRAVGKRLATLLGRPGRVAGTLRAMHNTGFLGRLVPEFARVTFLVQHDHYHRYTVDEHTLRVIEALDEVARSTDDDYEALRGVLESIGSPAALYLGALFHDVGKGRGGDHVGVGTRLAERACARLHLPHDLASDVVFLVRQHLIMSQISQRRDLGDDALIESFVREVGTVERLNLLLLLTYADHRGVGPGIWTDWKAALLWELYGRAMEKLSGDTVGRWEGAGGRRQRLHDRAVEQLKATFAASEVERHLAMLPDKYLRTTRVGKIAEHLNLVRAAANDPLVAAWQDARDGRCSWVTVCTRDAPGVFARIAGALTVQGLDILSVDVYTRDDGMVLDTFAIRGPRGGGVDGPLREEIEREMTAFVAGRHDVREAVSAWQERAARAVAPWSGRTTAGRGRASQRTTVRFDEHASAHCTVVEVGAENRLGLAYLIAQTLTDLGLNIHFAKIASEKSQAWDVFYVTDAEGQKLEAEARAKVTETLTLTLDEHQHQGSKERD